MLKEEIESSYEVISSKCDQISRLQSTNTCLRKTIECKENQDKGKISDLERKVQCLGMIVKGKEDRILSLINGNARLKNDSDCKIGKLSSHCEYLQSIISTGLALNEISPMKERTPDGTTAQADVYEDPESSEEKEARKTKCDHHGLRLLFKGIINFTRSYRGLGSNGHRQPGGGSDRRG